MPMDPIFLFGVFYALLCQCVLGSVPSATNVSVVCHNFVNVLYWNYSHPAEQLKFSVLVRPYESVSQTVDTSQTYLDISNYSKDAADDYSVSVTAHVGQEKSETALIKFTYSKDYYDEKKHAYKCSLDFPAVNASVHKDEVEMYFWHPYEIYDQDILYEEFKYKITHDQKTVLYSCFEDEEGPCTAKIHLNQSLAGQCVELKFEGKIAAIPTYTYKNVCVPHLTPETDHTGLIAGLLGGGFVLLFITVGVVWVLCKKWNEWPKVPEVLRSIIPGQPPTALLSQTEQPTFSPPQSCGHQPLLNKSSHDSTPESPDEKVITTDFPDTDGYEPKSPLTEDSDGESTVIEPSGYNSPKCLDIVTEIGPEDFAEGYGPRPAVI